MKGGRKERRKTDLRGPECPLCASWLVRVSDSILQ